MASYGLPDITGINPNYKQANIPFFIYQNGIQISFENSPVYKSSIVITLADGTGKVLDENLDWVINPSDIDETAMSKAFLENNSFNDTLVKSLTFTSNASYQKYVAVTFQEFYLTLPGRNSGSGAPFEVTPDLIEYLNSAVADLRQQMSSVTSPVVANLQPPSLLPFDINGTNPSNLITNEVVTVNTVAGGKVIRLINGAFFADSVSILYNGTTLNPATDYMPIVTSPLTERTTNVSGIYKYILLNNAISGQVSVNYRAVGGDIQPEDIQSVYTLMLAIQNFLNNGSFLTSSNVATTPAFTAMNARQTLLESQMRSLLAGAPTYQDATAGMSVIRPITATDANLHWWTIATLYQVAGSTTIVTADRFKGRVYFPNAKVSITFTADVNLLQARNNVSITTESLVFDPLYTLFTSQSVASPVYPLIRVVWNQSGTGYSGACLQIGLPLTSLADQMIVEDLSTTQSCWILDQAGVTVGNSVGTPSTPQDTGFTLPDGASTWASNSGISYSSTYVPEYKNGYLVYTGTGVNITNLTTTNNTASLFNSVLPYYLPVGNVKSVLVTFGSSDGSKVYDVDIPVNGTSGPTSTTVMGNRAMSSSTGAFLELYTTLSQQVGGTSIVTLNIIDTGITLLPVGDTGVHDVVRYIRAKV